MRPKPLIVALYAGPGVGKSVTAMRVAAELKCRGEDAEYVPEYAKELVYEGRFPTLGYQPYVAAKQMWMMDRLDGQVDVIVTDTSPLLSLVYGRKLTPAFRHWLVDDWMRRDTLDILLRRWTGTRYNPNGRNETLAEAQEKDREIAEMLASYDVEHLIYSSRRSDLTSRVVVDVQRRLHLDTKAAKE